MKCKYPLLAVLSIFILHQSFKSGIPAADPLEEVKKAMDTQVNAWNNKDLEKAMGVYWNSPKIMWIGRTGIKTGYQPVLEDFQKEYTDRSKMGTYSYDPLHIEKLAPQTVYFVIRWKIELDGKKLMGGVSSLLWKKIDGKWVITSEHAS